MPCFVMLSLLLSLRAIFLFYLKMLTCRVEKKYKHPTFGAMEIAVEILLFGFLFDLLMH